MLTDKFYIKELQGISITVYAENTGVHWQVAVFFIGGHFTREKAMIAAESLIAYLNS